MMAGVELLGRGDRRNVMRILAVACLALVCSACDAEDDAASSPVPSAESAVADGSTSLIPTLPPQDGAEGSFSVARLEWDAETGCIVGSTAMRRIPLVFPHGYTSVVEPHAIVNEAGEVVATEGDVVRLGGGGNVIEDGRSAGSDTTPCPDGDVFLVQSPIEILIPVDAGVADGAVDLPLHHCGLLPVEFNGRLWEVPEASTPFDGTNAPETFIGRGVAALTEDGTSLAYEDASGIALNLVPDDAVDPPCD